MLRIVVKRLLSALITLFLATLALFIMIRLAPGDPVEIFMGRPGELTVSDPVIYQQRLNEMREKLGLDQNIAVQYVQWIKRLLHFDLGTSIFSRRPVATEISERLPATILLSVAALLIQLIVGIIFGIISAVKAGKLADNATRIACVFFASIPAFVLGLLLLSFFAVKHNMYDISNAATFNRLWLPAIVLGVIGAPQLTRMVRSSMLTEFGKNYIVFSISRGFPRHLIVWHALKNALLPISTLVALAFTTLMGGAVVVESVFSWPGIGSYALSSVLNHDYPVIQGYTVIMVSLVIIVNFLVDLAYMSVDPQLRVGELQRRF